MLSSEKTAAILQRYGILPPAEDALVNRVPAFAIICREDDRYGKVISIRSSSADIVRTVPLTREKTLGIIDKLRRRRAISGNEQEARTLEHLLMRCSMLYVSEDIRHFSLGPIFLLENGYTVGGARIARGRRGTDNTRRT